MCGIVGLASTGIVTSFDWLSKGTAALRHRGPDEANEWHSGDGRVGFGHRRLAIVDLSPLGRQPMTLPTLGLTIAFNGEIYNFKQLREELIQKGWRFSSAGDTEVLLTAYAEWGVNCVTRLNGMFAFAVHDFQKQTVFLARDRAGEKPLFYYWDGVCLYFASELKALLLNTRLPRQVDYDALDCYLGMGFVPGARCILAGFRKLPAAHALSFDLATGDLKVWPYWQVPAYEASPASKVDEASLLDEFEQLLEESVSRQLCADVPVGILLSGGIDSSLVTAMAARASSRVRTFTIGFPGSGHFDETAHARLVAKAFNTDHVELAADPSVAELLPRLAEQVDEPLVDSSLIPTSLVSMLVRQHCKVALGGDGCDELFGGYRHYRRLLWLARRSYWMPHFLGRLAAGVAQHIVPLGIPGRNYVLALGEGFDNSVPMIAKYFDHSMRRKLLPPVRAPKTSAETVWRDHAGMGSDLLQRATRMDFRLYLTEDILVKVDRSSMAHSLEMRAPFLDHHVIDFAFRRVPSSLKASEADTKILPRQLARRILPKSFDFRRKQGFSLPLNSWLKGGPFRDLFWDTLLSRQCAFDRSAIRSLLTRQDRGFDNGERLFALVQFELWRRYYRVTL